jgi:CDP-diacylglycerol--serine O-phosphatidyltransferase
VKRIPIIPTLLTLGNAVCGFGSIACASKVGRTDVPLDNDFYFALSGWLLMGAMVFDLLDGYVARLSKTASDFGLQLDSLCDAISFGAAPAFLLLRLGPGWELERLHYVLSVIAAFYMVCAILRLARFNIETIVDPANKRFRGLPSPAAAGCLGSLAILRGELIGQWPTLDPLIIRKTIEVWSMTGALVVALLMVSRVPFPHLTKQILRGRRPFGHLIQVVLAGFVIFLIRDLALVLLFWFYALWMPARYYWARSFQPQTVHGPAASLDKAVPPQ